MDAGPLLVFGPRSPTYDFGALHPLTPRRFGPGIDLLRAVGAEPGLAPELAPDDVLELVHSAAYIATVKAFSSDPVRPPAAGIGPGDDPPFAGMHEAGAAVAGGSVAAMKRVLDGQVEHAFHPGGGLHHAMPDRASGFCIYDDPAVAIAIARRAGSRVLYVDLDVHHGDGVQAIHADDPGVMTLSFHESGRYLFPGTGSISEVGQGIAAGTVVNVPLDPMTGDDGWLAAIEALVPALAAAFGPDVIVSQHGADTHAWDPLAHLRITTGAMGRAARLVDEVAHREAAGRWLATGGGGYDAYRVVPRAWALTWLAGAHREVPETTPLAWRERWAEEAARWGQSPLPERFEDERNAGLPFDAGQQAAEDRARTTAGAVRRVLLPRLLVVAEERGWWRPDEPADLPPGAAGEADGSAEAGAVAKADGSAAPTLLGRLDAAALSRLRLAPRVVPPADPRRALRLLARAVEGGAVVVGAGVGDVLVGVAAVGGGGGGGSGGGGGGSGAVGAVGGLGRGSAELLALGVDPAFRRRGLGRALLRAVLAELPAGVEIRALITLGDRDVVQPLDIEVRRRIARDLLEGAGLVVRPSPDDVASVDRGALEARSATV